MTTRPHSISLADYHPAADGATDDTAAFARCFADAANLTAAEVVIPLGEYYLSGEHAITLTSNTSVTAHGARFILPETLGEHARIVLFSGRDIVHFQWSGGTFVGRCFDHRRPGNTWAPNANTRAIVITTSKAGVTDHLTFVDIMGERVAGAVVNVEGASASESEVDNYATRVSVTGCRFHECGKFMWDYGLLWQILCWPGEYTPEDVRMAERYFFKDRIHGPVRMADGDDRVFLDNSAGAFAVSKTSHNDEAICFYNDKLPANVMTGKKYYIVSASSDSLKISETVGGPAMRFVRGCGPGTKCMSKLHIAYYHLYAPAGAGPGKGGLDLVACRNVHVSGCTLSGLGDTMHIQKCRDIVFANNQITGSRMGAFFLAEHCRNATITGNTIDGTNGSRVMSIERSCTDVTVIGNTFRNGGRGSWINQPRRLVIANNVFINNTTKSERDPWRGRKLLETGDYGNWPEMYFTTYEAGATYGPVVLSGNIFETGPECSDAIDFKPGGREIVVTGNVFGGGRRTVVVEEGCEMPTMANNVGLEGVKTQAGVIG